MDLKSSSVPIRLKIRDRKGKRMIEKDREREGERELDRERERESDRE